MFGWFFRGCSDLIGLDYHRGMQYHNAPEYSTTTPVIALFDEVGIDVNQFGEFIDFF